MQATSCCILLGFLLALSSCLSTPAVAAAPAASAASGNNTGDIYSSDEDAPDQDVSLQKMEMDFLSWVNWIADLPHPMFMFGFVKNKFKASRVIVVSKLVGVGNFRTIQEAVNAVPDNNNERIVIQIGPGYYREKVSVPITKPYITFQGSGSLFTIIDWSDTASTPGPDGKPMGTFSSATVAVYGEFFIARNITFKNSAVILPASGDGKQAVAFRISGDSAAFYGCHFLGSQDTLYDHIGRHYFSDCYIEGSVDFIFGDGHSYFDRCHLHAVADSCGTGAVTAQKRTNRTEQSGFSFVNCRVTGSGTIYLGRAWGQFSRVVYAYTYMDDIVVPNGWYNWGDPKKEQTVFYGQYKCSGPGANSTGRVVWSHELTAKQARPFLDLSFIDGSQWLPT